MPEEMIKAGSIVRLLSNPLPRMVADRRFSDGRWHCVWSTGESIGTLDLNATSLRLVEAAPSEVAQHLGAIEDALTTLPLADLGALVAKLRALYERAKNVCDQRYSPDTHPDD